MFSKSTIHSLVLFLFAISFTYAHTHHSHQEYNCSHNINNITPGLLDVQEEFLSNQTRFLTTASYPGIRITPDYSNLIQGTADFITYVQTALMPPVLDYFRAALAVKQPLTSPLKVPTSYTTMCGFTTPSVLFTGVSTDLYVIVSSTADTTNWVASAGACYLSSTTKRTLIAQMLFNLDYTSATTDPLVHERNTYLTLHEMTHALGFTLSAFSTFIDANGNTLTGQIKTVLLNGSYRTVLDVEPLTTMVRNYFGCSTLPGAFMENDGGAGTAGSHFERRHFLYEYMTSGVIYGLRVSNFTLALLEGSGWYQPNYTYAEPFFFGQGEGCNFLYQDCNAATFSSYGFQDFCYTSGTRGCTPEGESGGVCQNDTRSDGCMYYIPPEVYDCEYPGSSAYARFPSFEVFGRSAGSRCFQGNVSTVKSSTQTSYCLKYTCVGSGLSTTLQVSFGSGTLTCTSAGQISAPGYYGLFNCPDPLTYCSTAGVKYCPRNCMGRGTCVNNVCQCNTGYTGIDCALNA